MKKKLITFLILFLMTSAVGQEPYMKPMLGRQIKWEHPLSHGLVGGWLFNEGAGNLVNDLSGSGISGVMSGGPSWSTGIYGSKIVLNGAGNIDFGVCPSHLYLTGDLTIICKCRPTQDSLVVIIGNDLSTAGGGWCLITSTGGTGNFGLFQGSLADYSSDSSFDRINWVEVAVTVQGTSGIFYLNGRYDTAFVASAIAAKTNNLYVGTDPRDGAGYEPIMDIDHIYVYNRALTASEIQQLYREPFCMIAEDLPVAMMYNYTPAGGVVVTPYYYRGLLLIPVIPFSIYYLRRRRCAA